MGWGLLFPARAIPYGRRTAKQSQKQQGRSCIRKATVHMLQRRAFRLPPGMKRADGNYGLSSDEPPKAQGLHSRQRAYGVSTRYGRMLPLFAKETTSSQDLQIFASARQCNCRSAAHILVEPLLGGLALSGCYRGSLGPRNWELIQPLKRSLST